MQYVKTLIVDIIAWKREKTLLSEVKMQKHPVNAIIVIIARPSLWKRKALHSSGSTFPK